MYFVLGLGIKVVEGAKPIPVPCYFKNKTELELEKLVNKNNFQPAECSGRVSPIVQAKKLTNE